MGRQKTQYDPIPHGFKIRDDIELMIVRGKTIAQIMHAYPGVTYDTVHQLVHRYEDGSCPHTDHISNHRCP